MAQAMASLFNFMLLLLVRWAAQSENGQAAVMVLPVLQTGAERAAPAD
jgi:hypothetical protein